MQNNPDKFIFGTFHEDVDSIFTDCIHNLPEDLISYLKSKVLETNILAKNRSFQLELVTDTNILFSEVRSLMVNNSSFFLKIAANPFIKLYGPSQLREELYEKIKIKFPKDKKTKIFKIEDCLANADLLLSKITICDDISAESLIIANKIMQERDPKDISFVALNFSLRTHGILTKDKDISDNKEIKTWKLRDAGEVITDFSKGAFSLLVLNTSIPPIWEVLYGLLAFLWAVFIEIANGLIAFFVSILSKSVKAISKIPPALAGIIGISVIIVLLSEELRSQIGNFFQMTWNEIKKLIRTVKDFFHDFFESMKDLFEALKPFLNISFQLFLYFVDQSSNSIKKLTELEASRPS